MLSSSHRLFINSRDSYIINAPEVVDSFTLFHRRSSPDIVATVIAQLWLCCYYEPMLHITFENQYAEIELDGYNHSDDDIRAIVAQHFRVSLDRVRDYEIDRYGKNVVFRPEADA